MEHLNPGKISSRAWFKDYVKAIWLQPYRVPKGYEEMLERGVESLILLGVLEVENDSEWGSSSFAQTKPQ